MLTTGVSLAQLMAPIYPRRGIYILTFSDGNEYVGQSIDVVIRFRQHVKRMGATPVFMDFAPVEQRNMNTLEEAVIHSRKDQGASLLNKLLVRDLAGRAIADHWVKGIYCFDDPSFYRPQGSSDLGSASPWFRQSLQMFFRLMAHRNADQVLDVLATYLEVAMPSPCESEGRSWVAVAHPGSDDGTNVLASVTIERLKVVTVRESLGKVLIELNLAPDPRITTTYGAVTTSFNPVYGEVQQVVLGPEKLMDALTSDLQFRLAARRLSQELISRGPSLIRDFHSVPLTDAIYGRAYRAASATSTSPL